MSSRETQAAYYAKRKDDPEFLARQTEGKRRSRERLREQGRAARSEDASRLLAEQSTQQGECLIWTGLTTKGFGRIELNGEATAVHRLAWENARGPLPAGQVIERECGRHLCINVNHMRVRQLRIERPSLAVRDAAADTTGALRLATYVEREGECLVWTAYKNPAGYGLMKIGGRHRPAYRVAYELAHGPIPEGLEVDHLCRNRGCVNPDHLEAVTHKENLRRSRVARGLEKP